MKKARVLFVSQEITPYLPENDLSTISRNLPQGIQERGKEIRTFMPRYGCINERRHQLHEVIRLSGMNLIIDDADHPLIIKVGSIQPARMQVYFIDNEEYFKRKAVLTDESGKYFEDNDERSIFFCRGVIETIKKLGWAPDVIHCHGWMTAMLPLYIKKAFNDDPNYAESKVVYSVYNDGFKGELNNNMLNKALIDGVVQSDFDLIQTANINNINKLGMHYADAVIHGSETLNEEMTSHMNSLDKPVLGYHSPEEYIDKYNELYDEILENNSVLAD